MKIVPPPPLAITIFKMHPPSLLQPLLDQVPSQTLGIDFVSYKIPVVGSVAREGALKVHAGEEK